MRIIVSLFFICFLAIGVFGQQGGTIKGSFFDSANGETQQKRDANTFYKREVQLISADGKITKTKADRKLDFVFINLKSGTYTLRATNTCGVVTKEVVVEDGQVARPRFDLSPPECAGDVSLARTYFIETVDVAAGTGQAISEVSKTVDKIDLKEIIERNEISLADALKTIPGFRVQQLGGFGRTASIKTRGLRNQDTAILVDGFRVRDPAAITGDASALISDFSLANVGRVEVLRGSGSSIYGTNAIGGVVDFQTPKPESGFNGGLVTEFGGLGLKRVRGNVGDGTRDEKFGFNLGVSRIVFSEGIDGEDDAHNTNFQGRIDYKPFLKTHISGRVFVSDAFVRLNANPDTIGALPAIDQIIDAKRGINFSVDANDPDNYQFSKFFSGQAKLTQIINSRLVFTAAYQGLKTSRENENGGLGPGFQPFGGTQTSFFRGQIHTFNSKFDWTPASNNLVTFGYEYELEKYGNEGIGPFVSANFYAKANQTSNTFYAQNLVGLFEDKLQLAGGFRAQFFALDLPTFSVINAPYSGVLLSVPPTSYTFDGAASYYFAATGTKIRAHAGNGYRAPSLYERFGTFYSSFSQRFSALGDPDLEPERSIAFDGGIDQTLADNRVRLSATYFYTKLIDTIGYANVAPAIGSTMRPFGGYFNNKGGISRGAEFSSDVKISDAANVFASYTFTNSDQREAQVASSGIRKTLGVADHQFTLVATHRFGTRLSVNFDFLWASSYLAPIFSNSIFSTRIYSFEGARKGDLTARYEHPAFDEKVRFVFFGTVENIFQNEYFENGFQTAGRSGRVGLGLKF